MYLFGDYRLQATKLPFSPLFHHYIMYITFVTFLFDSCYFCMFLLCCFYDWNKPNWTENCRRSKCWTFILIWAMAWVIITYLRTLLSAWAYICKNFCALEGMGHPPTQTKANGCRFMHYSQKWGFFSKLFTLQYCHGNYTMCEISEK